MLMNWSSCGFYGEDVACRGGRRAAKIVLLLRWEPLYRRAPTETFLNPHYNGYQCWHYLLKLHLAYTEIGQLEPSVPSDEAIQALNVQMDHVLPKRLHFFGVSGAKCGVRNPVYIYPQAQVSLTT